MSFAIRVDNLGKCYQLGMTHAGSIRELVNRTVGRLLGRGHAALPHEVAEMVGDRTDVEPDGTFWALRDLSFEVKPGEVVGIIGRNGAGKSTLLKILSQITSPTHGRVELHGRVASLLEVGTGFHLELSGRENVFLNGAILGMTKTEIRRKFDQIVAFAEIEKFIDTPVKRYSSGMYMRLAFAVAAHLDPEILLVDEVLAVGDAEFQKKCLGKIGEVARGGRTVLFVSHSIDAIRRLCERVVWLQGGRLCAIGSTHALVSDYILQTLKLGGEARFDPPLRLGNGIPLIIHKLSLSDRTGRIANVFSGASPIRVSIEWESLERLYKPRIGFVLQTDDGVEIATSLDACSWREGWVHAARRLSTCTIPERLLNEGNYILELAADGPPSYPFRSSRSGAVLRFTIEDDMTLASKYYGEEGFRDAGWPGVLLMDMGWSQATIV